jgi:hypothetical protein
MAHTVQIIEHKDGSWLTEQKIATKSPGAITINPNGSMISVWPARGNVVYTLQRTRSVYLPKNTMHNAPEPISTTISADLSVAAHVQVRPPTIRRSSGAWHQSAQSTAVVTIWRHDDSSWHESYMLRPESPISSCAISPRGDVIALGSQNTTDIIFWPAALKKILDELTLAQISLLSDIYKYRTTHPHSLLMLDAEQEKVFASLPFAKTTVEDIKSRYAITTKKT